MADELFTAQELVVDPEVIENTWAALRTFGAQGCECLVLWLGTVRDRRAYAEIEFVPPQRSIKSEDGVGYFVSTEVLFQLNVLLSKNDLTLVAQVHSHPTEAYHSATDDAYAIVTQEGGFSIVVPDFGADAPAVATCAIYRLRSARWTRLDAAEAGRTCSWGRK